MANKSSRKVIPWWEPQLGSTESELVRNVLASNYLNEGDVTTELEREVARRAGAKYAVATTSGTAALFLSLAACGIGPGDEVLVPDLTFIATANAVSLTGAKPVLVDTDPLGFWIDLIAAERAITPRTKAILPVHVTGRAAPMAEILKLAKKKSLLVIEDAAEAFLSLHDGKALGTFGAAGCFSFSPNKTITCGQGGMIITSDEAVHGRLRELKDQGRPTRGTGGDDVHYSLGYNFKLTNLQAAVALGQMSCLAERQERLKRTYSIYAESLRDVPGIRIPTFRTSEGEVPQWVDALVDRRNELYDHLAAQGAHCRKFWHPLHTQAPYRRDDVGFKNSIQTGATALWLPSAFTLGDNDIHFVCDQIKSFLSRRAAA